MLVLGIIFASSTFWHGGGPARWGQRPESPMPTRKQRFAEYVRGERQLMADWEEAFDPAPRVSFRYFNDDYLGLRYGVPKNLGAQVWWEEMHKPGAMPPSPTPGDPMLNPPMDPYQPVAGYTPSMRFSSSQVCWDHARHMYRDRRSRYDNLQRVVSQCERMDA